MKKLNTRSKTTLNASTSTSPSSRLPDFRELRRLAYLNFKKELNYMVNKIIENKQEISKRRWDFLRLLFYTHLKKSIKITIVLFIFCFTISLFISPIETHDFFVLFKRVVLLTSTLFPFTIFLHSITPKIKLIFPCIICIIIVTIDPYLLETMSLVRLYIIFFLLLWGYKVKRHDYSVSKDLDLALNHFICREILYYIGPYDPLWPALPRV